MSATPQTNPDNQEIDLSQVSKKIGKAFENFSTWIFRGFLFIKRNLIILVILFIIGAGIGFYLDKTKHYDHQIIVSPNFSSVDYLYAKINLLDSKITERDTVFLNKIGIKNSKKMGEIQIKPILDPYRLVENRTENFELLKLMAEDGDINKIIIDPVTSKNYPFHKITFSTTGITDEEKTVKPIMAFLNDNDHFEKIKVEYGKNLIERKIADDSIISQIDGILKRLAYKNTSSDLKNDKLVYYNENSQLDEVIKTKSELIKDKANIDLELLNLDQVVKKNGQVINIKKAGSIFTKYKFILPFGLILIFITFGLLRSFYRHQMIKFNK